MNIYVVTEGPVEKRVYQHWIPFVNPSLSSADTIDDIVSNNFLLVSAGGYPAYFQVIENAIEDVNTHRNFDRLVVSIDSEEMSYQEKLDEVTAYLADKPCNAQIIVVVQHFCFETWALGNRLIIRPNTESIQLRKYRRIHDVRANDPELLPANDKERLTRSQFAEKYLRAALNDKFRNLTYSKTNPSALIHNKYFRQLQLRLSETSHIMSFGRFLQAFV